MRGGRDYINDMANVSECNPFGLKRNIGRCTLVKNTDLPEQFVEILPGNNNSGESIEGSLVILRTKHELKFNAPYMGFKVNKWTTSNIGPGTFTIIGGGGRFDDFIEIETISNESTEYEISIEVTDQKFIISDVKIFEHIINIIES